MSKDYVVRLCLDSQTAKERIILKVVAEEGGKGFKVDPSDSKVLDWHSTTTTSFPRLGESAALRYIATEKEAIQVAEQMAEGYKRQGFCECDDEQNLAF